MARVVMQAQSLQPRTTLGVYRLRLPLCQALSTLSPESDSSSHYDVPA